MSQFPIRREKPDTRGKRLFPKPGQTVGLCNICRVYRVFDFRPVDVLACTSCGWVVSREDPEFVQ